MAVVRPWCGHVRCRDAVDHAEAARVSLLHDTVRAESLTVLSRFRTDFYDCLTARADALFELTEAMLCTEGPVRSLVDLALVPEHRRGHRSLCAGLDRGGVDVTRLRRALAGVPLPRAVDGRSGTAESSSSATPPRHGKSPHRRRGIPAADPPQGRHRTSTNRLTS